MLGEAGGDASEAFDDIEHSEEAKGRLPGMLVGVCPEVGRLRCPAECTDQKSMETGPPEQQCSNTAWIDSH